MSFVANTEKIIHSFCANCQLPRAYKKLCSRCRAASYCSEECQRKHWENGHRKLCCDKDMDMNDFEINFDDYI